MNNRSLEHDHALDEALIQDVFERTLLESDAMKRLQTFCRIQGMLDAAKIAGQVRTGFDIEAGIAFTEGVNEVRRRIHKAIEEALRAVA